MKVSLIIPTRNEENCIGRVLKEIPRKNVNEVIIIDGCSTDNTIPEAKLYLKKTDKLICQKSTGYGAAYLEALSYATGDVIVMIDGDGSKNPGDIPKLITKINQGFEYVTASRYIPGGKSEDDTLIRHTGNILFTWLTNFIHRTGVSDSLYVFTAITKKNLNKLHLRANGFEFCTEIVIKAHRAGLKFAEVPVIERTRFAGRSKVNAFWHGLKILRQIFKKYEQ